MEKEWKRN